MDDFAAFERQVEEALTHLYDPAYHPPELLCLQLGLRHPQPHHMVRDVLVQAVEQLQPADEVPASARVRRIYDLLALRYLQEKTQKESALRLGITVRHLRREQQLAIHLLAERLWEQPRAHPLSGNIAQEEADETHWREQLHRELHALQNNAPGVLANVYETLAATGELMAALAAGVTVEFDLQAIAHDLWVAAHPSVLREVMITAFDKLVPSLQANGIIRVSVTATSATVTDENIEITLCGDPATLAQLPDSRFIDEVLDIYGGSFAVRQQGDFVVFSLTLPAFKALNVLVVDDNDDLVHFYRRYAEGTRYTIHHVAQGQQLWEKLESVHPAAIVLDVMLPDIDGWDVLRQLHQHPLARSIPVIICSVIQHDELARTLGATLCLSKPVRRNDFLHALDLATRTAATPAIAARTGVA